MNIFEYVTEMAVELKKAAAEAGVQLDDRQALLVFTQLHMTIFELGIHIDGLTKRIAALEAASGISGEGN